MKTKQERAMIAVDLQDQEKRDHIDALARRWSLEHRREVNRSDAIRALLDFALHHHPLREGELDELRRDGIPKGRSNRPTLRLVDGRAELELDGAPLAGGGTGGRRPLTIAAFTLVDHRVDPDEASPRGLEPKRSAQGDRDIKAA